MPTNTLVHIAQIRSAARSGATRDLRLALGLSLPEFAAEIGVSPSTVWRWETGESSPRGAAALRYRAAVQRLLSRVAV